MNEENPAEVKRLGSNIVGYKADKWHAAAKSVVYPGIKRKFTTHPRLMQVLHATKGMKLVEASFDKVWGTHSEDCLTEEKWHGVGILGEILMQIREETSITNLPNAAVVTMPTSQPYLTNENFNSEMSHTSNMVCEQS